MSTSDRNRRDHPRVGGEKSSSWVHLTSQKGSPPRGRGKAGHPAVHVLLERITPAWAGKSLFCFAAAVPIQDHPRMGGEKLYDIAAFCSMWGSPPRGRGKAQAFRVRPVGRGITPAWAGKSGQLYGGLILFEDYPRVGGEKSLSTSASIRRLGSPPRWRGKGPHLWRGARHHRITPAWTGKSWWSPASRGHGSDHPRVGGEKRSLQPGEPKVSGSPPRGRGKVLLELGELRVDGITPA